MKIPFTKAHGARNDFLLTWRDQLPASMADIAAAALAICDRHTGAGADGWLLISPGVTDGTPTCDRTVELRRQPQRDFRQRNALRRRVAGRTGSSRSDDVRIATGAGVKHLRLLDRHGIAFRSK